MRDRLQRAAAALRALVRKRSLHVRYTEYFKMAQGKVCRVVHVVQQLDTGGMEKLLVEFARHADRSQFDLRFLCLGAPGVIADEIEALGWPVIALREQPGLHPGLVCRLSMLFRASGANVVHTHNTRPVLYCAPAARLAGIGTVVHTRHGLRHDASARQTMLFRWATRLVDKVVCVSEESARQSIKEGIQPGRLSTVCNGVDTVRFGYSAPVDCGPAVMVGRLSPEKDVATLLKALKIIVHEEPRFRLEIAGDGVCRGALEKSCNDLGIERQVRFLGNVKDMPRLLARASMCVLSSITEGMSLTLLESMARGLPVVATRVGGNSELVVDGQTGLLVPARNPEHLAVAMLRLWRDAETARRMGLAGRQRVEAHFNVRRMVMEYEMLYRAPKAERRLSA